MSLERLSLDELLIELRQPVHIGRYMLLLGAGASISSGVPGASGIVTDLLREKYSVLNRLPRGLVDKKSEAHIRHWAVQKLKWYNPASKIKSEYQQVLEKLHPIPENRNDYLRSILARAWPHKGYRELGRLIEQGIFSTIWTTNFDHLIAKCTAHLAEPLDIVNSEGQFESLRPSADDRKRLVRLHGDFWHGDLLNTKKEMEVAPQVRFDALQRMLQSHGLIVVGYGGNDKVIMRRLIDMAKGPTPFNKGLYWCVRGREQPSPLVARLLRSVGENARLVEIDDFDRMMERISEGLKDGRRPEQATTAKLSFESLAMIADFVAVKQNTSSRKKLLRQQRQSLRQLTEMLGADRAVCVHSCSGRSWRVLADSFSSASNSLVDVRSDLLAFVAVEKEDYHSFPGTRCRNDELLQMLSGSQYVETLRVRSRRKVIGFAIVGTGAPLDEHALEFRVVNTIVKLMVGLVQS